MPDSNEMDVKYEPFLIDLTTRYRDYQELTF